jgi:hypothetical protein
MRPPARVNCASPSGAGKAEPDSATDCSVTTPQSRHQVFSTVRAKEKP